LAGEEILHLIRQLKVCYSSDIQTTVHRDAFLW